MAPKDKCPQGWLMHSPNFPGITPCSCHFQPLCACRSRVAPLTALTHKPGHNTAHYSWWWAVIPVWSPWPCLVQPRRPKICLCFDVKRNTVGTTYQVVAYGGHPHRSLSFLPSFPPSFPLPLRLHSWPSSLLSSNCSSVLGNAGRKSQSFCRTTMTIKNIFLGRRKVRKRGRKCFSWDGSKEGWGGGRSGGGRSRRRWRRLRQKGRTALVMVVNPRVY